ncbi:MAG: 50S ribosomal protein L30 [Nitrospirota bacterium]
MVQKISITLIKSCIGRPNRHKLVAKSLGLKKINQTVIRVDRPEIRGMIRKITHLLQVKEIKE